MSEVRVEEPTCTAVCKVSWLRTCGEDNAIIPSYSLSLPLRMKGTDTIEKPFLKHFFVDLYYIFPIIF